MKPFPSLPKSPLDSPFLKWWLIYFGALAYGWCALAGVGFILLLAFAGDSGRIDAQYFEIVLYVVKVLFVWPLIGIAALSAMLAFIHQMVLRPLWCRFKKQPVTMKLPPPLPLEAIYDSNAEGDARKPQLAPDQDSATRQTFTSKQLKLPLFKISTCLILIMAGTLMVVGNAPRSLKEHGLGPTIFTALIFLIPLVALPSVFLFRTIRRLYFSRGWSSTK